MMKLQVTFAVLLLVCLSSEVVMAQHCSGVMESYLSRISLKHVHHSIRFGMEYRKDGKLKEKYQAYLVGYFEKNADKIPSAAPHALIDTTIVTVLHTQLIEKNESEGYDMEFQISSEELATKMIRLGSLTNMDRPTPIDPTGFYEDKVRLAVFVPFLDDEKYAVLPGLPLDKHECNYSGERALIFQQLPYLLTIRNLGGRPKTIYIYADKPVRPGK